jgi:signal peptidase I
VNGVSLDEEAYVKLPSGAAQVTRDTFEVTVPDDSLWVMGDNRYSSADSAYHRNDPGGGFVPIENVVGRALVVSWPINRWQWLDDYPFVFREVEDAAALRQAEEPTSSSGTSSEDSGE